MLFNLGIVPSHKRGVIHIDHEMRFNILLGANGVVQTLKDINSEIERLKNNANGIGSSNGMSRFAASYSAQINQMRGKAEELYQTWRKTGDLNAKAQFDQMVPSIRKLQSEFNGFNRTIGTAHSNMGLFAGSLDRIKTHSQWILSGLLVAGIAEIGIGFHNAAKEAELALNKIKQNMELAFEGKQIEENLQTVYNAATVFAQGFGVSINEILNSLGLLSRRWKDPSALIFLENLVLTLAKIDNMDIMQTSQRLESVALQFNLSAKGMQDFATQFSAAVHLTNVTGVSLLEGLERSGASFATFNMGTKEAIALISTLTTVTARSGSVVGRFLPTLNLL